MKRKVSPFFLLLPVYLPFIAVLSLFFARFHGLEAASELKRNPGEIRVIGVELFSTVFINPDIYSKVRMQ